MGMRPVASFTTLLFLALLLIASLASTAVSALPDRSWSRTLTVAAGDSRNLVGGIDLAKHIEVYGTVSIRSCCGFSTNDIGFRIRGADYGDPLNLRGGSFGVIVGNFAFEWNSGQDYKYEVILDNRWIVCGGSPFNCTGNVTSPSYHDKTVELSVREDAPLGSYLLGILPFLLPVLAVVGILTVGELIALLRRRRHETEK